MEHDYIDIGYSSRLLEIELSSGNLMIVVHDWNIQPDGRTYKSSLENVGQNVRGFTMGYSDNVHGLGFNNCLLDNGPNVEEMDRMVDDFSGPVEINHVAAIDEVPDSSLDKQKVGDRCRKSKKVESSVRRRRKSKKGMVELVYDANELEVENSESSLSDRDIKHRNSVILGSYCHGRGKSGFGLSFDCVRDQLIEVFKNLEEKERIGKR